MNYVALIFYIYALLGLAVEILILVGIDTYGSDFKFFIQMFLLLAWPITWTMLPYIIAQG